jgi:ABC-2 type transport system ATP-binding protein
MMSNNIVELTKIRKRFDIRSVLLGLNLDVPAGTVLGLMGRNGAGKSTLIKCLLGLLKPDSGKATVFDEDSWNLSAAAKQRIGYVPQTMPGFRWMKAKIFLDYIGSYYQRWNRDKVLTLMKEWGITGDMRISRMSEGEIQKLSIIRALGHEPDLLVFDEPVASLDPLARRDFLRQIVELGMDEKRTMIFSSHIASDLERVASEIVIIKEGVVAYRGELAVLQERIRRIRIQSEYNLHTPIPIPNIIHSVVEGATAEVTVDDVPDDEIMRLGDKLSARITIESLNLEDIFLEVNR